MVIVSGLAVNIFFSLAIGCCLLMGFASWHFLLSFQAKGTAELLLYISILVVSLLILMWYFIVHYSRKRGRTIEKMIELARLNGVVDTQRFSNFGKMGTGLKILFRQTEAISKKRARRIFFMNSLINVFLDSSDGSFVVFDIEGKILYASEKALIQGTHYEILERGVSILEYFPEFDFTAVATKASHEHAAISISIDENKGPLIPIYGEDGLADGFLFVSVN